MIFHGKHIMIKDYLDSFVFVKNRKYSTYRIGSHVWHKQRVFLDVITTRELEENGKRETIR